MEQAKASKKFKIALAAMAVALVAVAGGLVGVWAATQQSVKTSFDVQYTVGKNIAATVTVTEDLSDQTDSETFLTTATTVEGLSLANQIKLDPTATSVTFTYTFVNNGTVPFRATLTDNSMAANVTIAYAGDDTTEQDIVVTATTAQEIAGTTYVDVAAGATETVTVTVTVKDVNAATASYVSNATNGVTWVLDSETYVAPQA